MLYMFRAAFPPIIRSSKTVRTTSGMCQACLLPPLAWLSSEFQLNHARGCSKQAWHIPDAVCIVFELLMMDGKTAVQTQPR